MDAARAAKTIQRDLEILNRLEVIRELCGFLGVECTDEYVDTCSRSVFPSAENTREIVESGAGTIREIEARLQAYDFLAGYTFSAGFPADRS